jgi:hypothetical protein
MTQWKNVESNKLIRNQQPFLWFYVFFIVPHHLDSIMLLNLSLSLSLSLYTQQLPIDNKIEKNWWKTCWMICLDKFECDELKSIINFVRFICNLEY